MQRSPRRLSSREELPSRSICSLFGRAFIKAGDEIIVSEIEHHSNIVPWQMLAEERGAKLLVIPVNDAGELRLMFFKTARLKD